MCFYVFSLCVLMCFCKCCWELEPFFVNWNSNWNGLRKSVRKAASCVLMRIYPFKGYGSNMNMINKNGATMWWLQLAWGLLFVALPLVGHVLHTVCFTGTATVEKLSKMPQLLRNESKVLMQKNCWWIHSWTSRFSNPMKNHQLFDQNPIAICIQVRFHLSSILWDQASWSKNGDVCGKI